MEFLIEILKLLGLIVASIVGFVSAYLLIKTFVAFVFVKDRRHWGVKRRLKHRLWNVMNTRYLPYAEVFKWVVYDTLKGKDKLRLYGIWAFTGYYGEGKTMGCVLFAKHLQRKYPHRNIKIYSNIKVQGQVKQITDWKELLDLPPNSIMIYDESQSDWNSNMGHGAFPDDFLRRITQVRKKQFALFMTSPRFNRMNINIREAVNFVVECKNVMQLDRYFSYTFYREEDYSMYKENKIKLFMHKYLQFNFVVQNKDYRMYNTVEQVESIKSTEDKKLNKKEALMLNDELKKFENVLYLKYVRPMEEEIKKVGR